MTASRKLLFLSAFMSLFVFACTEEIEKNDKELCDVAGAFECLKTDDGSAAYRICVGDEWIEAKCRAPEVCRDNACVALVLCEKTATRCLDAQTVEKCAASEVAKVETCGDGLICNSAACAKGQACCVPTDVCEKTATRCLDAKTVEACTASEAAKIEVCGDGLVCDTASCGSGGACCVVPDACKETATRCVSLTTKEICVEKEAPKSELCGEGFVCDVVACAKGEACCVAGKICSESATQCLDLKAVEHCTASEVAQTELCDDGFVCDAVACAKGEDCCVEGKVCSETGTQCLNLKTVEHCTASEVAQTSACGEGLVCDTAACANGEECCVEGKVCSETASQCLDLRTSEICVKDGRSEIEICDKGFYCDFAACADGRDCCALGKVCDTTVNTCLNEDLLETCVKDQRPSSQSCGAGMKCELDICVPAACVNNRLDVAELAVDCGGLCAPCVACRADIDCGKDGFCDSAFGYVCSKRCRTHTDCKNSGFLYGESCRSDGRCAPKVFETVWELTAGDPTVVLPLDSAYYNVKCDFQILWGDEPAGTDITTLAHVKDCYTIANRTHTYPKGGRYNVQIIGTYDGWGAFDKINMIGTEFAPAASKLRSVTSFGPVGLGSGAFFGAQKLETLPNKEMPDASKLSSLDNTFNKALIFNSPIGHWDTSHVNNMGKMFWSAEAFNQKIGAWDVSKVIQMSEMFYKTKAFDQPIGAWDCSKVTNMSGMFVQASSFNQSIVGWDTSHVTKMGYMFGLALAFNQAIGAWNTSQVVDMEAMFNGASVFNQSLAVWDTSKVTNMFVMFKDAKTFNQPIGAWNTSQVSTMSSMFDGASVFDQNLSPWVLKTNVNLNNIFVLSGMSADNLCVLKALGGAWLAKWAGLGKTADCK